MCVWGWGEVPAVVAAGSLAKTRRWLAVVAWTRCGTVERRGGGDRGRVVRVLLLRACGGRLVCAPLLPAGCHPLLRCAAQQRAAAPAAAVVTSRSRQPRARAAKRTKEGKVINAHSSNADSSLQTFQTNFCCSILLNIYLSPASPRLSRSGLLCCVTLTHRWRGVSSARTLPGDERGAPPQSTCACLCGH